MLNIILDGYNDTQQMQIIKDVEKRILNLKRKYKYSLFQLF